MTNPYDPFAREWPADAPDDDDPIPPLTFSIRVNPAAAREPTCGGTNHCGCYLGSTRGRCCYCGEEK